MQALTDFSQLQGLFNSMSFREAQTKKQAEAERIKKEIAELEAQVKPVYTEELMDHPVQHLVSAGGAKKQSPVTGILK
jgi:hypothetical protein